MTIKVKMTLEEFDVQMQRLKKRFFAESVYTPAEEKKIFAKAKYWDAKDFAEAVSLLSETKKAAPSVYEMMAAMSRVVFRPLPQVAVAPNPNAATLAAQSIELLKKRSS